jgi:hypothetical protein
MLILRSTLLAIAGSLAALTLAPSASASSPYPEYPPRKASECAVKSEAAGVTVGIQLILDPNEQKTYFNADLLKVGYIPIYIVLENSSSDKSFLFNKKSIRFGNFVPGPAAPASSLNATSSNPPALSPLTKPPAPSSSTQPEKDDPLQAHEVTRVAEYTWSKSEQEWYQERGYKFGNPNIIQNVKPTRYDEMMGVGAMALQTYALAVEITSIVHFIHAQNIQQRMLRYEVENKTLSPGRSVSGFLYIPLPSGDPGKKTRLVIRLTQFDSNETVLLSFDF